MIQYDNQRIAFGFFVLVIAASTLRTLSRFDAQTGQQQHDTNALQDAMFHDQDVDRRVSELRGRVDALRESIDKSEYQQSSVRDTLPDVFDVLPIAFNAFHPSKGRGYCESWQIGNRSLSDLMHLEPQSTNVETFEVVQKGMDKALNVLPTTQSVMFCDAARRLGWVNPLEKFTWKDLRKYLSFVPSYNVSMICNANRNWKGWKMLDGESRTPPTKISRIAFEDECAFVRKTKIEQFNTIRTAAARVGCNYVAQGFFAESFDFSKTQECRSFFERGAQEMQATPWVIKENEHKFSGTHVVSYDYLQATYSSCATSEPFIVQKYVMNTPLINGHKWDLRYYVLVASFDPLIVYTSDLFLARMSKKTWKDPLRQVKVNSKGIVGLRNTKPISPQELYEGLKNNPDFGKDPKEEMKRTFDNVKSIVEFIFHTIGRWDRLKGRFRMYAFDFVVNESMNPVFMDLHWISDHHDFHSDKKFKYGSQMVDQIYEDAVQLVHDVQAGASLGTHRKLPRTGHFHLTYMQNDHAMRYWDEITE